jgi:hypothetical protein
MATTISGEVPQVTWGLISLALKLNVLSKCAPSSERSVFQTIDYVKDKPLAPTGKEWDKAVKYWNTLRSDEGAHFDKTLSFKASDIKPQVTWGIFNTRVGAGANKNFVDFNV